MPRGVPKSFPPSLSTPKSASNKPVLDLIKMACEACGNPLSAMVDQNSDRGFCFACGKVNPHKKEEAAPKDEACPKCGSPKIADQTVGGGSMYCGECTHRWQRGAEALSLKPKTNPRTQF